MSEILAILSLVYQAGDFVVKAILNYANTPEGEVEWSQVISAATGVGLVHPQYVNEALAEDDKSEQESVISQQAADFVKGQEQQDKSSAPASTVFHRMPIQHGEG